MAFTSSKFSFGDVLLVPFPFTDQVGIKKSLVLSFPIVTTTPRNQTS